MAAGVILALADVPAIARRVFAPLGEIVVEPDPGERLLSEVEVMIIRGSRLGRDTLERAPRLRAVARTGSGYDNLDVAAATRLGIPIVYAPEVGSQPVAEGAFALILAAAKRLRQLEEVVQRNDWRSRYEIVTLDIEGACLGLVGYGSIGRRVARLAGGVGMRVLAHDPVAPPGARDGAEMVSLGQLVQQSDIVSLHCDLTPQTHGLVDAQLLACFKPGSILVNVARGQVVESEDVLLAALASGRLSAVALDVFPEEPPRLDHPLYSDPRVICTPHVVGLTERWNEQVFGALVHGVREVLAGRVPANVLNREVELGRRGHPAQLI
jgi:D-3-phosphoglycerate dehydrogenase / 2-oxoglutarate reductase